MAGWEDLDQALPLDVRDVAQAREDLDRLALRVFGTEDDAYYREGQNSIVRDIEAKLIRARKM